MHYDSTMSLRCKHVCDVIVDMVMLMVFEMLFQVCHIMSYDVDIVNGLNVASPDVSVSQKTVEF